MTEFEKTGIGSRHITLEYQRPEPVSVANDNWAVTLRPRLSHVDSERGFPRWDPFVEFEATLPSPVDYSCLARLFLTSLQDLITVAAGVPCWVTDIFVSPDITVDSRPEVQVLAASYGASSDNSDPPPAREWLFTRPMLGPRGLTDLMARWLAAAETFRAPRALLFEEFYRGLTPLENRFLLAVLAAETFHGLLFPNTVEVSDAEHEVRMAEVLAAIPDEHRGWVGDAIAYSNRPNLRRRLKELLRGVNPVVSPLVSNLGSFVHAVVGARNDLVHRAHIDDVSPRQLLHMTETLRLMLQAWLLKEAGLPLDEMADRFTRTKRFRNAVAFGRAPDFA